jgi:hypothetical protein
MPPALYSSNKPTDGHNLFPSGPPATPEGHVLQAFSASPNPTRMVGSKKNPTASFFLGKIPPHPHYRCPVVNLPSPILLHTETPLRPCAGNPSVARNRRPHGRLSGGFGRSTAVSPDAHTLAQCGQCSGPRPRSLAVRPAPGLHQHGGTPAKRRAGALPPYPEGEAATTNRGGSAISMEARTGCCGCAMRLGLAAARRTVVTIDGCCARRLQGQAALITLISARHPSSVLV